MVNLTSFLTEELMNLLNSKQSVEQMIERLDELPNESILHLSPEMLHRLKDYLSGSEYEEAFWEKLLPFIPIEELPDQIVSHLIQSQLCIVRLCHMNLPEKWLIKLIPYDDEPLYTLSKQYYLSSEVSSLEFIKFFRRYICHRKKVSEYLLEYYESAEKYPLLLHLCLTAPEYSDKTVFNWYAISMQVRAMTDTEEIKATYESHRSISIIALSVARNLFTPVDVLQTLSKTTTIYSAAQIRKASLETLQLKRALIK